MTEQQPTQENTISNKQEGLSFAEKLEAVKPLILQYEQLMQRQVALFSQEFPGSDTALPEQISAKGGELKQVTDQLEEIENQIYAVVPKTELHSFASKVRSLNEREVFSILNERFGMSGVETDSLSKEDVESSSLFKKLKRLFG